MDRKSLQTLCLNLWIAVLVGASIVSASVIYTVNQAEERSAFRTLFRKEQERYDSLDPQAPVARMANSSKDAEVVLSRVRSESREFSSAR